MAEVKRTRVLHPPHWETMDEQVASLENSDSDIDDGIAIIGVGLDLPNANSLEDY